MSTTIINSPSCIRVRANEQDVAYFPADTTDAAAGTTALQAQTDASSGDKIVLFHNIATTLPIGKDGVDWDFNFYTHTRSDNAIGFNIDDGGSSMSFKVKRANLTRTVTSGTYATLNSVGVINVSNASSNIHIKFDTATFNFLLDSSSVQQSAIAIKGGNSNIRGVRSSLIETSGNALPGAAVNIWWENGESNVNIDEIICVPIQGASDTTCQCVWASVTNTPTGDMRIRANRIDAGGTDQSFSSAVYQNGPQATATLWVDAQTYQGDITPAGGKTYITGQKLIGTIHPQSGKLYCRLNKLSGDFAAGPTNYIDVQGACLAWITIDQFEPGTNGGVMVHGGNAGAVVYLTCQDMTGVTGQDAVQWSAGTLNIIAGVITPASGKLSLKRTGGTLAVTAAVHYLAANTSGTITTLNLFGVVPGSTFKSTTIGT